MTKAVLAHQARILLVVCLVAVPAAAQQAPSKAADPHTITLAQGWAALAAGNLDRASAAARQAIAEAPHSVSALALAVEVEVVRTGPAAGLNAYEQWMKSRKMEEPYVLRRIATAFLHGLPGDEGAGLVRIEAVRALVADGDSSVAAIVAGAATAGRTQDPMLLVAAGDERAVQTMAARLPTLPSKSASISALGNSGSRLAIPPLMDAVAAGRDDDRAAAATALARLGAREAVSQIRPLLDHPAFPVRFAAAAALYRPDDNSGLPLLNQSLVSEYPSMRRAAAEALSVRPGAEWLDAARSLMSDADEAVQLGAARLVAPQDPELAGQVLNRLGQSDNLAMREEAGQVRAERVVSDLAELRRMLRSQNAAMAGRAARRLLELVR